MQEIPVVRSELLLMFEDLPAIDAGEAELFASASENSCVLVVTGDKRSICSLASSAACEQVSQALSGRIYCLEQIVKEVIKAKGFDYSKRKIVPSLDCDTSLRAIFGMGLDAEEDNVLRSLDSYIEHLRAETGQLLK